MAMDSLTATPETEAPAAPVSLVEQFKAAEAELDAKAGGAPVGEPAKPAAAAPAKPGEDKPEPAKKPEGGPRPGDWAALREEQRRWKASQEKREAEFVSERQRFDAERGELTKTSAKELGALLASGDYDEVAKRLGHESWEALNTAAIKTVHDPGYLAQQQIKRELETLKAERDAEKRAQAERQAQADMQRQQEAERAGFMSYVNDELAASQDETTTRFLAEDKDVFSGAVFREMSSHFNDTKARTGVGEQLDVQDAASRVIARARSSYERLHKFFGGQPTAQQAEAVSQGTDTPDRAGRPQQPARPTKHVTRSRAATAAPSVGPMDDAAWKEWAKGQLEQAAAEEDRSRKSA